MRGFRVAVLLLALGAPAVSKADALGDVHAREADVQRLDGERAQLEARRGKLEADGKQLSQEIEQLKAQPAGVRRDARLQELLAQQQTAADALQKLAADARTRAQSVLSARRALMTACDRALAGNLPESKRLELARVRTAQATLLATPPQALGISKPTEASTLDGPRDLAEKADLLRDSGDKLKKEVARLAMRIDDVERRRHLRERAGAVDEDVFGELTSNRRVARSASSSSTQTAGDRGGASPSTPAANGATGGGTAGGGAGAGAPSGGGAGGGGVTTGGGGGSTSGGGSPPPTTGPSLGFSDGSTAGKSSDASTVLRNLVDPATLDELRRADGSDDLERQIRAMRRAQSELDGLAKELEKRAKALNARADELKHKK
jgi:hypothetical protein